MYKKYIKRLLGFIFSLLGLPVFALIFIVVAPMIFMEDHGSIFYNCSRLGRNGKVYKMFKFRTMKVNAPDLRNKDGTRKTSLDETPQLLNVLIGNMSFIGPRPDLPTSIQELYRPGDEKKLTVNPGITGYSQAYYRNSSTIAQRFDGDVFYAENISFL